MRALVQPAVDDGDRLGGAEALVLPDQSAVADLGGPGAIEASEASALIGDVGPAAPDDDVLHGGRASGPVRNDRRGPWLTGAGGRIRRADGLLGHAVDGTE